MARCSGVPQSILIHRFTSRDIIEMMALNELELKESSINDRYYNGIMNQIAAYFGKDHKFTDYTEAWKEDPPTPMEAAKKRETTYRMLANV